MARTLQVRAVPEKVHRRLKARAADAGLSLSAYLLAELTRFAALPTREEMRERLRSGPRAKLSESAAKMIRRERGTA
ncbi:MAG: hypothetical protein R3F29_14110 [Planctomycetota bacterium]